MRKMIISMGYALAYLTVIGFYSYLKFNEPEERTIESYQNEKKRRHQANSIKNLAKKSIAKRNSPEEEQSYTDSLAHQQKKMRYN